MLVVAPRINKSFAHFNALFLQPTTFCARSCSGCYVKGFEKANDDGFAGALFYHILQQVNRDHEKYPADERSFNAHHPSILVNQLTMALDKMPSPSTGNAEKYYTMKSLFTSFLDAKHHSVGGEFHLTTHTINDLIDYYPLNYFIEDKLLPLSSLKFKTIDMLSISHISIYNIDWFRAIREKVAPLINWNLTIDPSVSYINIKYTFQQIAEAVDSIYLVLHKPSTGQMFDPDAFKIHQDFLRFIKTMPVGIQNKVTVDGCLTDSHSFLSTGYGCSSNVSRFQVWPNGSVTGCPYKQTKTTEPADTLEKVLNNIFEASRVYEFDNCKIPVHMNPQNNFVKRRSRPYLNILEQE